MNTSELTSLTKQNFWLGMQTAHPQQLKLFYDWIDQYKERVGWISLFPRQISTSGDHIGVSKHIKYHDLPIAFQIGIFMQYCLETPHRYELIEGMPGTLQAFAENMKAWFAAEHAFAMKDTETIYYPDDFAHN